MNHNNNNISSNILINNSAGPLHRFNKLFHLNPDEKIMNNRSKNTTETKYFTEEEYQKSFSSIEDFASSIPSSFKKKIRVILYHSGNTDGYFSAYSVWKYVTDGGKDIPKDLKIIGLRPSFQKEEQVHYNIQKILPEIENQYVFMGDLLFNQTTIEAIRDKSAGFLYVDDHGVGQTERSANNKKSFYMYRGIEMQHCACVLTFKIFYPKDKIPRVYQYIDNNDAKLQMPFIGFANEFNVALKVRITENSILKRNKKLNDPFQGGGFWQLHDLIKNDQPEFLIAVGSYMNEQRENIKFEVANNTFRTKMLGYDIGIINFEVPGFKVVARQMITDARKAGYQMEFAITWSYHHTTQSYHFQIVDDHKQNIQKLKDFVEKIKYTIQNKKLGFLQTGWVKGHIANLIIQKSPEPSILSGLFEKDRNYQGGKLKKINLKKKEKTKSKNKKSISKK